MINNYNDKSFLFLILAVFFNSISQILIKIGSGKVKREHLKVGFKSIFVFFNPFIFIAIILLFFATISYLLVLSKLNVSYAYPLMSGSYIIVLLLSRIILKEKIIFKQWIGVFIIITGIFIIVYHIK